MYQHHRNKQTHRCLHAQLVGQGAFAVGLTLRLYSFLSLMEAGMWTAVELFGGCL